MDVGSYFADGVRRKWASGLNVVTKPDFPSVEKWLLLGSYSWLPVEEDGCICFDTRSSRTSFSSALASEISRFSCAAYESLLDSISFPSNARSLGWPLVRHYYATFYCAHALLRVAGSSLTYISTPTAVKLNLVGGAYLGASPQVVAGSYLVSQDPTNKHIVRLRSVSKVGGGSHEDMWKLFLGFLVDIENTVIATQGDVPGALEAVHVLTQLRKSLCSQGKNNGAWPSAVRNAVNYRHDYGVWYPYGRPVKQCEGLAKRMTKWRPDVMGGFEISSGGDELGRFADICNVVVKLLTASLQDISRRSPSNGNSFVDRYPFKLLRLRDVVV